MNKSNQTILEFIKSNKDMKDNLFTHYFEKNDNLL